MTLIDTHCHLYLDEFLPDIQQVIYRAISEGIEKFYLPAIDSSTWDAISALEQKFPGKCIPMTGLHPCSVKENYTVELQFIREQLQARKFAGIGETGLDFYWDRTFEAGQYIAFHQQVELALDYDLPVIIHSRESIEECITVIGEHQKGRLRGIFHCFSGNADSAKKIVDLGFYLGIGGVVTFKNSGLAHTLKEIDLANIVLETDAPYLAPVPFRGKRNESSYIKYIVTKLAEIKETSVEEIASITTQNALKIFAA